MKKRLPRARIVFVQQNLADYRLGFYQALRACLPAPFILLHGESSFSKGQRSEAAQPGWSFLLENRFLLARKFLVQGGHWRTRLFSADVLVVEFNYRTLSTWLSLIVRRIVGKRTVLWGHAQGRGGVGYALRPFMISMADAFVCYTALEKDKLHRAGFRLPIGVANNACVAVDAMRFRGECPRSTFVYVGRLSQDKKPELLLSAFRLMAGRRSGTRLMYVGDGPLRHKLEQMAREWDNGERVQFLGQISDLSSLARIYDEAIASVSPGFVGLSSCQSFSFGVPMIVARDEPHSPEIAYCREGFNCVYSPSDDPVGLALTLDAMIDSATEWRYRGEAIVEDLKRNGSFEAMARGFAALLDVVTCESDGLVI